MRRELPLMLVFLAGVVMAVQFFVPSEFSGDVKDFMSDWLIIIGIFAMALGIYSLVRVSMVRIRRKSPNWQYSVITLVGLFAMIVFGLQLPGVQYSSELESRDAVSAITHLADSITIVSKTLSEPETGATPNVDAVAAAVTSIADSCQRVADYVIGEEWILKSDEQSATLAQVGLLLQQVKATAAELQENAVDSVAFAAAASRMSTLSDSTLTVALGIGLMHDKDPFIGGQASYMFRQFFNHIMIPIQATMFSLLAFFIASAAYRAFRARSVLATVLLVAALVLMLRLIPMGPLTVFLSDLSSWILLTPNLAAKRAILIGVGLGMVATALKVVLGIERNYLGRD